MPGAAESIRMTLRAAKIPFEDIRLKGEQFGQLKPSLPFGQVPVCEIDGKQICQSQALLRFAGRLAKLYPECPMEACLVDEMLGICLDIRMKLGPSFYEQDEAKKMAMRKALAEETLPDWFGKLDKFMGAKGTKYCAGGSLSIADIDLAIFAVWLESGMLDGIPKDILSKHANIMKVINNTREDPVFKSGLA